MRLIGAAERGMQLMIQRAVSRKAFDKFIAEHGSFLSDAAKVRLVVLASKSIAVKPVSRSLFFSETSNELSPAAVSGRARED